MNDHALALDAGIERRLPVRELGLKAERVAEVVHALEDVAHDEHGRGTAERRGRWL
jgi:hypothetical protein